MGGGGGHWRRGHSGGGIGGGGTREGPWEGVQVGQFGVVWGGGGRGTRLG